MRRILLIALFALVLVAPAVLNPATAEATTHQTSQTVHVVQPGETLFAISMRYGVSAAAIAQANNLVNPDYIYAGQRLVIPGSHHPGVPGRPPTGSCTHIVQAGDTLSSIAWRYGTTVSALMQANGISNPDFIYAGQTLRIPGCGPSAPVPPSPGHPSPPSCGHHYVVRHGDTLSGIAVRHGTTTQALARANGLSYPYTIYAGQRLHIPCGKWWSKPSHPKTPDKPKHPDHPTPTCPRNIQIVEPKHGEKVSGTLQIIGSASIDDFQFYKLEYAQGHYPLDSAFHSINDVYTTPVWDSVLGTWFTGNMPNGDYTLRLTAVDNEGQFPRPCDVPIKIEN